MHRHAFLTVALTTLLLAPRVLTAAKPGSASYAALEITPFEVPSGIDLPADFQSALASNLVEQLEKTHKFSQVFLTGQKPGGDQDAPLRLTGSITTFKKGSQAKRYLLGPGFGKTILKAHIQFIDAASGTVKFEKDVDGKVIIGLFGGDSKGATNGLAKEVAKNAKNKF